MMRTISLFILCLVAQMPAIAQLDTTFFYGSLLAARSGQIIFQQSHGFADIEAGIPNSPQTNFELASLSKVFTAVAVMQLAEKSYIRLDDPVNKYLEDFPYAGITIRQLLSHTSGLPDFEIFDKAYQAQPDRVFTKEDIIPALKAWGPLKLPAGGQWSYSSPGMGLLALIVEKVSHVSFQEYLAKQIFKPAGMKHTYLHHIIDSMRAKPYSHPYYFSVEYENSDTVPRNQQFLHESGAVEGPGLVVSSIQDLYAFDKALFAGKLLRNTDTMFTPVRLANGELAMAGKNNFGLGWFLAPGSNIVMHSGYKPGTNTILLHDRKANATVIILDNGNSGGITQSGLYLMRSLLSAPAEGLKAAIIFPFGRDLVTHGIDHATLLLGNMLADTVHYTQIVRDWIAMGYEFFRTGHLQESLATFRAGHLLYPDNDFLCMLYGDAIAKNGDTLTAREFYKKALLLNPSNKEVAERLK